MFLMLLLFSVRLQRSNNVFPGIGLERFDRSKFSGLGEFSLEIIDSLRAPITS